MTGTPSDPEGLGDVAARLREALAHDADRIVPEDRLAAIRAAVAGRPADAEEAGTTAGPTAGPTAGTGVGTTLGTTLGTTSGTPSSSRRTWLPLGAAAAVAVIAVAAWVGLRPDATPPVVGGPTSATSSPTEPVAPSMSTTAPTTAPPSGPTTVTTPPTTAPTTGAATGTAPPAAGTSVTLPVYFVEETAPGSDRWRLAREFQPHSLLGSGPDGRAVTALLAALFGTAHQSSTGSLEAWEPGTTVDVTSDGREIAVTLSRAGRAGLTAEQQRVAVQQIVWTVTAALQADLPVRVGVAGGGRVFETMPSNVYKRPAETYLDTLSVWIDAPAPGAALAVGATVTVTGQACTFEAAVPWELDAVGAGGGTVSLRTGTVTAASACPTAGGWSVDLGTLPAGSYVFHARDLSAEDGRVVADQQTTFTVG